MPQRIPPRFHVQENEGAFSIDLAVLGSTQADVPVDLGQDIWLLPHVNLLELVGIQVMLRL